MCIFKHCLATKDSGNMMWGSCKVLEFFVSNKVGTVTVVHGCHTACLCCQGLAYDEIMLRHTCVCRNDASHPENPSRLLCIWSRFLETGLHNKCEVLCQEHSHEHCIL